MEPRTRPTSLLSFKLAFGTAVLMLLLTLIDARQASAEGTSIVAPDPAGWLGEATSLVIDDSGNPVVSYLTARAPVVLKVLHCGEPSCIAGNTITEIGPASGHLNRTAIALDAEGNPVVAYLEGFANLRLLHCGNPNCSEGNSDSVVDTGQPYIFSGALSLAIDQHGNPVIAYQGAAERDLKVLTCGNAACSSGNTIARPHEGRQIGAHPSLVLDHSGNPAVSYHANSTLKVLRCGNPTCTADNTIATPNSGDGTTGLWSSMKIDANDNPVVSYFAGYPNDELRVLICADPSCDSGNMIVTPDDVRGSGRYTTLVLDDSGYPVVVYADNANSSLKLLRCGNATCSSENSIIVLDQFQFFWDVSFALDNDGIPAVSYYFSKARDLRILRCSDPACTSAKVGDTSCDGSMTSVDALLILQFVLDFNYYIPCQTAADINGDEQIDVVDALLILKRSAATIP